MQENHLRGIGLGTGPKFGDKNVWIFYTVDTRNVDVLDFTSLCTVYSEVQE